MKKLLCTILALAMLCSFMVVNVSAEYCYEEGFEFYTDYDITIECEISERGFSQYTVTSSQLIGQIIICTEKWFDDPEDQYYENYDYYTSGEIMVNGNTATYVENISEGYYERELQMYSEYYYYTIVIRAYDEESYSAWLEIIDDFTFNYEEDMYNEYYENYFPTTSTYWETDTFYIDTDMELVMEDCSEYYEDENAENYCFWPAEVNGEYMEDDAGSIDITVYHPDDAEELYQEYSDELKSWYEEEDAEGYLDVSEFEETKIGGCEAVQYTFAMYEDEIERYLCVSDEENVYLISIECSNLDYYDNEDLFYDLCDIVENDLHFNNAPVDDNKAEDKTDKDDKSDKETDDEKDEEEKDNSTVIIIVAVVAGVVILGVVAIVVLGKKKKQ